MADGAIFTPLDIKNVRFENRILRSSVGGRTCNYDGTVTDVWKNFEKAFAVGGAGGIISTTFHVNKDRLSPLQYPSVADDKYVPYLKKYIAQIRGGPYGCKYIVQIGDPGYATYTSLFPEERDAMSSSAGFDFAFGYNNTRRTMPDEEIKKSIAEYAAAARRVKDTGADGVEITATKGYLIHQFLNPGINRRTDQWGGDADRRFLFLAEIIKAVRAAVGPTYMLGVRLSGADLNYSPVLLALARLPSPLLSRERWVGNELPQMLEYAQRLESLGVDYLHVVSGYGFPNPRDVPGEFPFEEIRMFFDSVRHLSFKAAVRAALVHIPPTFVWRWLFNLGWRRRPAVNLDFARAFKNKVRLPVIANGGFQEKDLIEQAIGAASCDMVSMARALIANPNLPLVFGAGKNAPAIPCSHCNKCVGRTTTGPLGCYDERRFASRGEMVDQILGWNRADPP
jgi:2,4-dienoyl-CoA reductase (NADPH2)